MAAVKRPEKTKTPIKRKKSSTGHKSWFELFVFFLMAFGIYLIGALLDASWTGLKGQATGAYLRSSWGGAIIIPILFWLYLCFAWFIRFRIPRPLGQILGTLQLYISSAFTLGLFKKAGWMLGYALTEPGRLGETLAHFFLLNLGALGAVLVAFASLFLSAMFYGSRLPALFFKVIADFISKSITCFSERKELKTEAAAEQTDDKQTPPSSYKVDSPPVKERKVSYNPIPAQHFITEVKMPESSDAKVEAEAEENTELTPAISSSSEPQTRAEITEQILETLNSDNSEPDKEKHAEDTYRTETSAAASESAQLKNSEEEKLHTLETSAVSLAHGDGRDTAIPQANPDVILPEDLDAGRVKKGLFPPPLDIFGTVIHDDGRESAMELANTQADVIVSTLQDFGVKASVAHIVVGPSVIQFQLELAPGIKVSKVSGLANDLTMALAVVSVRVEAPILGQRYVGIEIPNPKRKGIALRSMMEAEEFQNCKFLLPLPMGMKVDSRYLVCGLEDMPHLLVAGTTGSGKSVFVNSCILGMCSRRTPAELKLILVDPKHVEFAIYEGLPHLLARPVSDPRKAISALAWAVGEMEQRTESFSRVKVRNLASYNEKVLPKDKLPNIVIVVDELADLMYTAGKEVEGSIARLAQKARAAGIHLILATQRPSVDVITGLIKANVPARVAFAVPSQMDSRTIIDTGGAEKLLGKGDMLFYSTRYPRPLRLQAAFITEERTMDFVNYAKNLFGEPEYIEFEDSSGGDSGGGKGGSGAIDDQKLDEAVRVVMDTGIASASGLQRHLNIGYPRAGRLVTALEQLGIIGPQPANSSKPREILMDEESALEALEQARGGGLYD